MRYQKILAISFAGCLLVTALNSPPLVAHEKSTGKATWRSSSFLDFVDGTLSDGGANTYVAADGSIRLINLRDLNNDGQIDIVFPHTHDHSEIQDLRIYWGADSFSIDRRTHLPTNGGKHTMVADLNRDEWPDLVVANRFNGTKSELDAYIYWGGPQGFSPENRSELPTRGAEAVAAGDLDRDGHPELVFANSGLSYHVAVDKFQQSFIYWGSSSGYSVDRRSSLKTIHGKDVKLADLNDDGLPEVIFANQGNDNSDSGATIYWGPVSRDRSPESSTYLPGSGSSALEVADLDGDGRDEIVLANSFRLEGRIAGIYNITESAGVDSYIYWGTAAGYSTKRRTELPTLSAQGVAVQYLNQDNRPDVVFANGSGGASFMEAAATSDNHRTALLTNHATACAIGDLNRDGALDLVFAQPHTEQTPTSTGAIRAAFRRGG